MRALATLLTLFALGQASPIQFQSSADANRPDVVAKGAATDLPTLLDTEQAARVVILSLVDEKTGQLGPPILGAYEKRDVDLIFKPRYPLSAGQTYRAQLLTPTKGHADYQVPARPPQVPAQIQQVFPATGDIPANNLRFTIMFSAPMRGGEEIFKQIRLIDADGKVVEDPWLHDELWDESGCRLIVYIHPGRIKWGVLLRQLMGPVFYPDRDYTLVISPDMLDANGERLGKEFRQKLHTLPEDRKRIELAEWKLAPVTVGSRQPLTLTFPKAVDHASLKNFIAVTTAKGKVIDGVVDIGPGQQSWRFTPTQAWSDVPLQVNIDEHLEDLAGNTIERAFDFDLNAAPLPIQKRTMAFRPKSR